MIFVVDLRMDRFYTDASMSCQHRLRLVAKMNSVQDFGGRLCLK